MEICFIWPNLSFPGQALDLALVTGDCHPQVTELLNLRIYVSTDGTVFKQDVVDLGGSTSVRQRRKQQKQPSDTAPKPIDKPASVEEGYSVVNTPHEESFEVTPHHDEVAEEAVMLDDSVSDYNDYKNSKYIF